MNKQQIQQLRKDVKEIAQFLCVVILEIVKEMFSKIHEHLFDWFTLEHDSKTREITFNVKPRLLRKIVCVKLTYHLIWHKENRQILIFKVIPEWPSKKVVFGFSAPYLLGVQFETQYTDLGWNKNKRSGWPMTPIEYSMLMTFTEFGVVIGNKTSDNSVYINWKEIVKSIVHRQRAYVIEDGGWYNAIIPVNDIGDFKSEKLRIKVRRLQFKTVCWDWLKRSEKFETLYTFDLGDGIVVPDDYNVYDDHVLKGTTLKGIDNHMEAIRLLVDHITTSRKRRPKPNE